MVEEVLAYYKENKRNLPWRMDRNPYRIWISEIMCQQTQVGTAIPYFNRFMDAFPTIKELAEADDELLMKYWQGLGYYSRARNMKKAAITIMEKYGGKFPRKYEEILSLSGIGDYTAAAIASMAYDLPYIAVDGNFLRVFGRYFEDDSDIALPATKEALKTKLLPLLKRDYSDFNQAIMDIGATICNAHNPICEKCPLCNKCLAHAHHNEEKYPCKGTKTKVTKQDITLFIVHTKEGYLVHKRQEKGLLGGMYEFVNVPANLSFNEAKKCYPTATVHKEKSRIHRFSHIVWTMHPFIVEIEMIETKQDELIVSLDELQRSIPMPTAFSQFWDLLK